MDCGPTCLRMVAKFYGKNYSLPYLREKCYIDKEGVSLKGISEAAELIGLNAIAVKVPLISKSSEIPSLKEAPLPAIIHWNQNHFVVLYRVSKSKVWIADPASGKHTLLHEEFNKSYCQDNSAGIALILQQTPKFHKSDPLEEKPTSLNFLLQYLSPHKRLIFQLLIGLILGTVFQLIFPFLTQSLVDIGINTNNLSFINLVLIAQLMLFLGQTIVRFTESWILLHISTRININLVSDFLVRLMRLPLGFFDSKNTGDLLQRISDHRRIETFLTGSSLSFLLSVTNILVFGLVLGIYSMKIFGVFILSSILYIVWILIFLKKRKEVDYRSFQHLSDNQDSLIEIIQGMPEIKLQGSQFKRRWKWATIQAKYFRTQIKALSITQYQDAGAMSINHLKDIVITFIAATAVLDGGITLGMMLAIQYIIGQLNSPLQQLIGFIRSAQDASISLQRLSEIHNTSLEEETDSGKIKTIPEGDIILENLSFRYTPISDYILNDLNITIPRGKTTAIVGSSGSGKTTLIKLLLGFYKPELGKLKIGTTSISDIYQKIWRNHCGVVMQEGYIFSDSIINNIAESSDEIIYDRVINAVHTANIDDFIDSLPLGYNTKIGDKGNGISQGQKQRLLIARAVYKNPEFMFFDEATNALDSNNERVITNNLNTFIENKTAIIVAHRLSTVKNADQMYPSEQTIPISVG